MDRAENLRQGIWDGLSLVMLTVLFGLTTAFKIDHVFPFCALAGVFLVLHLTNYLITDQPIVSWIWLVLTATSAVGLVLLSGQIVSFLFLPLSLPAMRDEDRQSIAKMIFRGLLLPIFFLGSTLFGFFQVSSENVWILTVLFAAFSLLTLFVEHRLVLLENRRHQERLLLEQSVSEAINEKEKRQLLLNHNALITLQARQDEREALSRNIHNEVGHSITASLAALEAADILLDRDKEQARQKIRIAYDRMKESLSGIRKAVRMMDTTPYIAFSDLVSRIQATTSRFSEDTDTIVRFHADFTDENAHVPSEHAEFLLGAISELLSNSLRHGNASSCVLILTQNASGLRLTAEDNGNGAPSSYFNRTATSETSEVRTAGQVGFGLSKIQAYVETFGGKLMISPGAGFRVSLDFPVIWEGDNKWVTTN